MKSSDYLFQQAVIIGLGLIGGSVALSLKKEKLAKKIIGCSRSEKTLNYAVDKGVVDEVIKSPKEAVLCADLIVIATPVGVFPAIIDAIKDSVPKKAIITDVGSVKYDLIRSVTEINSDLLPQFVPGHPIAGSEKSGITAIQQDLFDKHKVILTPIETTDDNAVEKIKLMWQLFGAEVVNMQADYHDRILAATSHLPHLLAFALVDTLLKEQGNKDILRYAAGGFRDFTRIAASDPKMWLDIFLKNKVEILGVLARFKNTITEFQQLIGEEDEDKIISKLTLVKKARISLND